MTEPTQHCPTCGAITSWYKYSLGDATVSLLRKIWMEVIEQKANNVDVRRINLTYTERSQLTICRFHGLIAKVRDHRGKHIAAHWLITRRGGQFLRGEMSVPKQVFVFRNEVKAHGPELINIRDFRHLVDFGPDWERVTAYEIVEGNPIPQRVTQPRLAL